MIDKYTPKLVKVLEALGVDYMVKNSFHLRKQYWTKSTNFQQLCIRDYDPETGLFTVITNRGNEDIIIYFSATGLKPDLSETLAVWKVTEDQLKEGLKNV